MPDSSSTTSSLLRSMPRTSHQPVVLANLVGNALTHPTGHPGRSPPAHLGGRGRPRGRPESGGQGPGLTADQRERAFERFYRADAARSRENGGTGLGLAIVSALVAAHGGKVELDTTPGEGAVFRVLLPMASQP